MALAGLGIWILFIALFVNVIYCGTTFNLKNAPFNATGDGIADDRPAFSLALGTLKAGDTLHIPEGTYRLVLTGSMSIPTGATLSGDGPTSILNLESNDNTQYREFFRPGSNVLVTNLLIQRNADFPAVLMPLVGPISGFTMSGVTVLGNKDKYGTQYVHCISIGNGNLSNSLIEASTFRTCEFALFQDSNAKGTVDGFIVNNSVFSNNYASDLEFNAPLSLMKNITVTNSQFSNNQDTGPQAGWAVGLANVQTALVQNNVITNYLTCGIHVEDRSSHVIINNNRIINAGQYGDNEIFIVSNSSYVNVTNNVIDSRNVTRKHYLALATAGGVTATIPTNVLFSGNALYAGPNSLMWYLQSGTGPAPTLNYLQWEAELTNKTAFSKSVAQISDKAASYGAADTLNAAGNEDFVTYTIFGVPAGSYNVFVGAHTSSSSGQFQLAVNKANQGTVQDQYGSGGYMQFNLGANTLTAGDTTFNFSVTGKNSKSTGYTLSIDYILLAPQGSTSTSTAYTATTTTGDSTSTTSSTATSSTATLSSATSSTTTAPSTSSPSSSTTGQNSGASTSSLSMMLVVFYLFCFVAAL